MTESKKKIEKFEDLIVWQKGIELCQEIYRITNEGKLQKDWGFRDQIQRASVSIPSNIAEGFGKYSNKEFKKYLAIANGSSFEVRSQLHLACNLGYIGEIEAEKIIDLCTNISKLIGGLRRSIM